MKRRKDGPGLSPYALMGLGFGLFISSVFGLCLGMWLDRRTGGSAFSVVGLIVGLAAGLERGWTVIKPYLKDTEK